MKTPIVSIIIVNYKTEKEIYKCLSSIINGAKVAYEIIVVDNDEKKTIKKFLLKKFPRVLYIESPGNIGFGAGNNLGAKQAKGDFLFFLNPDTIVMPNCIDTLLKTVSEQKNIAIAAPILLDQQNRPYLLQGSKILTPIRAIFSLTFISKIFPNNYFFKDYWIRDWDRTLPKNLDIVPGSAFMIKMNIFQEIHGFDEKFFLFFDENYLCKRLIDNKYHIMMLPAAKVMHLWGKSTEKSKLDIKKIYSQSFFYYFKKHFGLTWAVVLKILTSVKKDQLLLLVILILGAYLRFKLVNLNLGFDGEVGDNLLDIKNLYLNKQIPLHGPPTSHPWLYFPPLFYWIYGVILVLSKFNPVSHSYYGASVSVLILIFNYFFVRKFFNQKIAIVSTFLITISSLYLADSITGRFIYTVPLLFYLFFFFLFKLYRGEKKQIFVLFLTLGILLNFHYTPIFFIPLILTVLIIKKIKLGLWQWLLALVGIFIPLMPIIIFDAKSGFTMLRNFSLWVPYRIAGFLGLTAKSALASSPQRISDSLVSVLNWFSFSFVPTNFGSVNIAGFFITLVILVFIIYNIYKYWKSKKMHEPTLVLILALFFSIAATVIHGTPPIHYFVPVFPIPILLFSIFIDKTWNKLKYFIIIFLITLGVYNIASFLNMPLNHTVVSYKTKQRVAQLIILDAKGKPFELKRVGYNDFYAKNFAQNYIYLLWWYGNEPKSKAKTIYSIVENEKQHTLVKSFGEKKFTIENVTIYEKIF